MNNIISCILCGVEGSRFVMQSGQFNLYAQHKNKYILLINHNNKTICSNCYLKK